MGVEVTNMPPATAVPLPMDAIAQFCRRWQVARFSLFGEVLGERLEPEDEVGVLLEYVAESRHDLFDWIEMKDQLDGIFGRPVEMMSPRSEGVLRNPYIRQRVLGGAKLVYAG